MSFRPFFIRIGLLACIAISAAVQRKQNMNVPKNLNADLILDFNTQTLG